MTSENLKHIENNRHVGLTSRTWFHPDHIDLRIGVGQVMASESSKIVFPWLDGGVGPVNRRMRDDNSSGTWCNKVNGIAKMAMILISPWRSA
jgi:hypothetical protein